MKKRKRLTKDELNKIWKRILGVCIICGKNSRGYLLKKDSDITDYTYPYYVRVKRDCRVCRNCVELFEWLLGDPEELCREYPEYFEIESIDYLAIRRMRWVVAYLIWKSKKR